MCHGSHEQKVYREFCRLIAAEIAEIQHPKRTLPKKSALVTMPMAV
jgi:hypothetical protein